MIYKIPLMHNHGQYISLIGDLNYLELLLFITRVQDIPMARQASLVSKKLLIPAFARQISDLPEIPSDPGRYTRHELCFCCSIIGTLVH